MRINLGDLLEDTVTGFKGIAVARTTWLHGCERIALQPIGTDKDGKTFETQTFDEPQLRVIEEGVVSKGDEATGGPVPTPQQKPSLVRRR